LWVPFVGLLGIISPLQTLAVVADLPIRVTAPWFWVVLAVGWLALLGSPSGRRSVRAIPLRVLVLALGVFVVQGAGVISNGVAAYRGDLQSDQYHYVVLAQFLMDEPYSTGWTELGNRPWLAMPLALKEDRIGQSVLHAFLAATARSDALNMFFPVSLLGPTLICPAALLLGARLGLRRELRAAAAVAAGLSPAMAFILGTGFLSQVLCVPLLVAFLAAVIPLAHGRRGTPLLGAAVTFALAVSVYTEFVVLFLGVGAVALFAGRFRGSITTRRLAGVGCVLVLALLLNPVAVSGAATVIRRTVAHGPQMAVNASVPVYAVCMWMHHLSAVPVGQGSVQEAPWSTAFVLACYAGAMAGVVLLLIQAVRHRTRTVGSLAVCSLLVPPVLVLVLRPESTYILCKLLWTLTPFLTLAVAYFLKKAAAALPGLRARVVPAGVVVLCAGVFGHQCFLEQVTLARKHPLRGSTGRTWNDADLQKMCNQLKSQPPTDIVIALDDHADESWVESGALFYHGRHHRIWLAAPERIWLTPLQDIPAPQLSDLTAVPAGTLVVRRHGSPSGFGDSGEIETRFGKYDLIRLRHTRVAVSRRTE
jgi:hypothetical protein